ncbi:4Fe-4S dicluster domain-containing protein [Photobacterium rosenbergii]|uniref:4Fe-4S dicluster domain-containing protein n=1 Tax=Photobacterium rosenbergii TaxID=294936 RepID=A0ABU3ZJJ4_9GAMM|nr:4Fe-4S dicluster domain-containing protein [Photobacterium rosenbergii]MDV5170291.1 4Fe-4S dicluster domain-containing protein [Photobacterium rosenbergii]
MHSTYLLDSLDALRTHLALDRNIFQVVASAEGEPNDVHWQQVEGGSWPALQHNKPLHSAKQFFFSDEEPLYVFDGRFFRETLPNIAPFVLFGVKSCDLMAIHYQDTFFEQDPYYQARRSRALLVGIDCVSPCEHGFCPTVNAGPSVRDETADLVLHPLGSEQWLLVVLTAAGKDALQDLPLQPASPHDVSLRWDNISHCEQSFPAHQYILDGIEKINNEQIPDEFWLQVGIQCLGCSGCTTLCPTCSCFATRSVSESEGEPEAETTQVRFWDSCLYEGFQREASFHNPSKHAGQRMQRFWYHKFSDDFIPEFGRYGCVGCGRCEQTCPGVVGVHAIMKRIADDV